MTRWLLCIFCILALSCSGKTVSAGKLKWDTKDLQEALKLSKDQKKPIMIVFGADW